MTKKMEKDTEEAQPETGSEPAADAPQYQEPEGKESEEATPQKEPLTITDLLGPLFKSLDPDSPEKDRASIERDELISRYLSQTLDQHAIAKEYNTLILHDDIRMVKADADKIYSAAAKQSASDAPLLLILFSSGGDIGSAYLISKLCRESTTKKFVVVVPRQAKSAATLICCGADEIHMGSLSELGPIDPQINNLPALGLKNAVEHIADLISSHPHASEMFAKYLHLSLQPISLGYHERVAESAVQYAEKLLHARQTNPKAPANTPKRIAHELVYSYKDHGFVIDKTEAIRIFGADTIHTNTPEYTLGNHIYESLKTIAEFTDYFGHRFYFIGSCDSQPQFLKKPSQGN